MFFNLTREGYDTLEALDGPAGLQLALEQNPDLVLLDLMLPGMNGFEVCRRIRQAGSLVPIVMLTAREEEDDKVRGLELGADDYITKPFKNRELMARVKANIRRVSMGSATPAPETADESALGRRVRVDEERATIFKDGTPLELEMAHEMAGVMPAGKNRGRSRLSRIHQDQAGDGVLLRRIEQKSEVSPHAAQSAHEAGHDYGPAHPLSDDGGGGLPD